MIKRRDKGKEKEHKAHVERMKKVLMNAIKMQALSSHGKITIIETSNLVH